MIDDLTKATFLSKFEVMFRVSQTWKEPPINHKTGTEQKNLSFNCSRGFNVTVNWYVYQFDNLLLDQATCPQP